jgi:hypothetical protein
MRKTSLRAVTGLRAMTSLHAMTGLRAMTSLYAMTSLRAETGLRAMTSLHAMTGLSWASIQAGVYVKDWSPCSDQSSHLVPVMCIPPGPTARLHPLQNSAFACILDILYVFR